MVPNDGRDVVLRDGVGGSPVQPDLEMTLASWRLGSRLGTRGQQLKPLGYLNIAGPLERVHSIVVFSLKEADVSLGQWAQAEEFMSWTEQGLELFEIDHGCHFEYGYLSLRINTVCLNLVGVRDRRDGWYEPGGKWVGYELMKKSRNVSVK